MVASFYTLASGLPELKRQSIPISKDIMGILAANEFDFCDWCQVFPLYFLMAVINPGDEGYHSYSLLGQLWGSG